MVIWSIETECVLYEWSTDTPLYFHSSAHTDLGSWLDATSQIFSIVSALCSRICHMFSCSPPRLKKVLLTPADSTFWALSKSRPIHCQLKLVATLKKGGEPHRFQTKDPFPVTVIPAPISFANNDFSNNCEKWVLEVEPEAWEETYPYSMTSASKTICCSKPREASSDYYYIKFHNVKSREENIWEWNNHEVE